MLPADYPWLDASNLQMTDEEYFDIIERKLPKVIAEKEKINKIYRNLLPESIQMGDDFQNWRFMIVIENRHVEEVNERQKSILFEKLLKHYDGDLKGKKIALWGLAFKPETDDMREAPALVLIDKLVEFGALVKVYDPVAMNECKRRVGDKVVYATDMYDAVLDADALLLVTEWKEFRMPSWGVVKKTMRQAVVIDGRNIYDVNELKAINIEYRCIGQ